MWILFIGENLRALRFKSSEVFLKCPQVSIKRSHSTHIANNPSFAPETGNIITNITQPLPVVNQMLAVIL